jgi:hypothetical protein
MYLHKTNGTTAGKTAHEPPVRNTAAKSSAPVPPAPVHSTPVPRSASALIAAAGLPADKLSASIISFARFFSLPIKPELMAAIRRQTLAPSPAAQADLVKHVAAENAPAAKIREALSLAAAAAESKGVELRPKGLETFAEAIDPDWQKREDSGEHRQRGRRHKNQPEEENAPAKTITAAAQKQMALESPEKNPLLALLNRLPDKNGRRWIVLPFSFNENGREYKVSLRILLDAAQSPNRAANTTAAQVTWDIAESGANKSDGRRWLFVLEPPKTTARPIVDSPSANRLTVYLQPEIAPNAHAPFIDELSRLMDINPERIAIKPFTESFPGESGCADDMVRSINEAV